MGPVKYPVKRVGSSLAETACNRTLFFCVCVPNSHHVLGESYLEANEYTSMNMLNSIDWKQKSPLICLFLKLVDIWCLNCTAAVAIQLCTADLSLDRSKAEN